mmetsp:Transcript_16910/g.30237  ORF Transcript_16910/g.30237 Transcript_16910/m.30237 type:complete len:87 (-) Transcript_16910:132-392(-)
MSCSCEAFNLKKNVMFSQLSGHIALHLFGSSVITVHCRLPRNQSGVGAGALSSQSPFDGDLHKNIESHANFVMDLPGAPEQRPLGR